MSSTANAPLIDLLGETRAQIVSLLHAGDATVADLATATELTPVAIRRQLRELVADQLVEGRTTRSPGPGRPAVTYSLTARGERLFPDRSSDLADDVLTFLHDERGKNEMIAFLRWRQKRQQEHYADALDGIDALDDRVELLAELLSADGFLAEAQPAADGYALTQKHCAIKDAAASHPQLCAFEAALFRQLLGAHVSRRQTIAGGSTSCVCEIRPRPETTQPPANHPRST
ncbi:MAG: ArsR family transcriptional regulator [Actinobacteria bacterium]|nr:ArsR family transcriptional regulator [Actinomycetota bacterium]